MDGAPMPPCEREEHKVEHAGAAYLTVAVAIFAGAVFSDARCFSASHGSGRSSGMIGGLVQTAPKLSRSEFMKIPSLLAKLLARQHAEKKATLPEIDDFLDGRTGVWCYGAIPANLKHEIAGSIQSDSGTTRPFSETYLRDVVSDTEGFDIVKMALRVFLGMSAQIIGDKNAAKGGPIYPWVQALCISPGMSVNAWAQLSVDTKAATVFYTINAGVFVILAHRFLAMFADEDFLQDLSTAPLRKNGAQVDKDTLGGSCCALRPKNGNLLAVVIWMTAFAALEILSHEQAHFYRGHLGYLRDQGSGVRLSEADDDAPLFLPENTNLRRRLELDADDGAGVMFSVFMREFDHPVPGPKDGQNERFFVFTVVAAVCTFLLFEERQPSGFYYPPAWRVQHFFGGFVRNFFTSAGTSDEQSELQRIVSTVIDHVEARCEDLGWSEKFNFSDMKKWHRLLIEEDQPGRLALDKELKRFMPHVWPEDRTHIR